MSAYPYQRGDRVGICISWKDGVYCKPARVVANDRQAGVLVTESDDPHSGGHGWEDYVFSGRDGGFYGTEIVRWQDSLPKVPAESRWLTEEESPLVTMVVVTSDIDCDGIGYGYHHVSVWPVVIPTTTVTVLVPSVAMSQTGYVRSAWSIGS